MYFVQRGYSVVAHDRRGHGRSTQTSDGHDMDTYTADAAAVVNHLDLRDAVHGGHSTGTGEVARYVAQHGKGRMAKAVLLCVLPVIAPTRSTRHCSTRSSSLSGRDARTACPHRRTARVEATRSAIMLNRVRRGTGPGKKPQNRANRHGHAPEN